MIAMAVRQTRKSASTLTPTDKAQLASAAILKLPPTPLRGTELLLILHGARE
jgi:hypothetical protein